MVRNYDSPDPDAVVRSIRRVLSNSNMEFLSKGAYDFLNLHCGYIAHYNHLGFVETYRDGMVGFVDQFLNQMFGDGWDCWLNNPKSYLYDVSYKGRLLADIIRELIPIFEQYRPAIVAAQEAREREQAERQLSGLAEKLGYRLEKGGSQWNTET